ncbi:3'-5' exoribonuclease domain-containing protein [Nonomuraea purpurea]|uniref:3'-5' exoribonuclease domain-containing protein n=1 Tax=Nonomuraea purpurea TaxID=1849276 RepID=A0ABV8G246_9ACTN
MTRIYYDLEFIEYHTGWFRKRYTIDLISIAMVGDDGREYYAVNRDMPVRRIRRHKWLMDNVVPHLPKGHGDQRLSMPKRWLFHYGDRAVKPAERIADEVAAFIQATPDVELWANYGAYDHVRLCWLWGLMIDKPFGVPMFTHDIQQEASRLGLREEDLPRQADGEHNALADARQNKVICDFLAELARPRIRIENHEPGSPEDLAIRKRLGLDEEP